MTLSCRTQGTFTVRFGKLVFTYGPTYIEFEVVECLIAPMSRMIPAFESEARLNVLHIDLPPWLTMHQHYMMLERYICLMLGVYRVQEHNMLPIVSLPVRLYRQFLERGFLRLDRDFHQVRRKKFAFYEIRRERHGMIFLLLEKGKPIKWFATHLEPRIPRGDRE